MSRTKNFRIQHDELLKLAEEITAMLAPARIAGESAKVRELLSKLAGQLRVHLAMEDKALYPTLLAAKDPNVQATARRFVDDMGGITKVFGDYSAKWATSSAIAASPERFVADTKALFGALGKRIERENQDLYPLADNL